MTPKHVSLLHTQLEALTDHPASGSQCRDKETKVQRGEVTSLRSQPCLGESEGLLYYTGFLLSLSMVSKDWGTTPPPANLRKFNALSAPGIQSPEKGLTSFPNDQGALTSPRTLFLTRVKFCIWVHSGSAAGIPHRWQLCPISVPRRQGTQGVHASVVTVGDRPGRAQGMNNGVWNSTLILDSLLLGPVQEDILQ